MSIFSDYFSLSSTNLNINSKLFYDSLFWRHLWCFNRVRGPLVTAPDLLLYVQYVYTLLQYLLVLCSLYNSRFSTLHALGHSFEGGLPWRIPAPRTVHRAPCNGHRAPTGLSPITDNQGVSHGKYEPLLQRPFIPTADAGPASQISIRSDRSL